MKAWLIDLTLETVPFLFSHSFSFSGETRSTGRSNNSARNQCKKTKERMEEEEGGWLSEESIFREKRGSELSLSSLSFL